MIIAVSLGVPKEDVVYLHVMHSAVEVERWRCAKEIASANKAAAEDDVVDPAVQLVLSICTAFEAH